MRIVSLLPSMVSLACGFELDEPYHHTQLLQSKRPKIVILDAAGDLSDKGEGKDDAIFFQAGMMAKEKKTQADKKDEVEGTNKQSEHKGGKEETACVQKMEPCESEQKTEKERMNDKVTLIQAPAPPPKEVMLQAAAGKPPAPPPKEALLQAAAGKPPAPPPKEGGLLQAKEEEQADLMRSNAIAQAETAAGKPPAPPPKEGLLQVKGCIDDNANCAYWAGIGECDANPAYMHHNCRSSCGKCEGASACTDDNGACPYWAGIGECDANPAYMHGSCKLSCGKCEGACTDDNGGCPYWARIGECDANPAYMHDSCRLSCGKCEGASACTDDNGGCPYWARIGECDANPAYMHVSCRLSCGKCQGATNAQASHEFGAIAGPSAGPNTGSDSVTYSYY